MNLCLPHDNPNITTAVKYICKNGEILKTDYSSRSCSKGSWNNILKVPANECLGFGATQFYDTKGNCVRDGPSLAPKIPGQLEKPTVVAPGEAAAPAPAPAAANNGTNSSSADSGSGIELVTAEFVADFLGENEAYMGDNCGTWVCPVVGPWGCNRFVVVFNIFYLFILTF